MKLIKSFGCNDNGQLGRATTKKKRIHRSSIGEQDESQLENNATPEIIEGIPKDEVIMSVSCGSRHSMLLTASGKVYSWGWGEMGQLGHGTSESVTTPKLIAFFVQNNIKISYISCGGCHSGAVSENGEVYVWGEAHWGQLGLCLENKEILVLLPRKCQVIPHPSNDKVCQLSCGGTHTAALTAQGHVYTWGRADSGQLGIGNDWLETEAPGTLGINSPQRVKSFEGEAVTQVSCGAFHTAAITQSGAVYTWGKEDHGMLGVGHTPDVHVPRRVTFFDDKPASYVSCGGWHTVVTTRDYSCYVFGRGEYGRLGLKDARSRAYPTKVDCLSDVRITRASCGGAHTLFLAEDGTAYSTGRASHGRLGTPQSAESNFPTKVSHDVEKNGPILQLSAGGAHSMVLFKSV